MGPRRTYCRPGQMLGMDCELLVVGQDVLHQIETLTENGGGDGQQLRQVLAIRATTDMVDRVWFLERRGHVGVEQDASDETVNVQDVPLPNFVKTIACSCISPNSRRVCSARACPRREG